MVQQDPEFFSRLAKGQTPEYLWIGCSDSRVPANQITGMAPGDIFVHRNVANVVVHTDLNCLSVIQYAVEVLQVKHIIICGHYQCSGVIAASRKQKFGLIDNWLRHIQDVQQKHHNFIVQKPDSTIPNLMSELNVIEQTLNVCQTTIVQDAWEKKQGLEVIGMVYSLENGLLKGLIGPISSQAEIEQAYTEAIENLKK